MAVKWNIFEIFFFFPLNRWNETRAVAIKEFYKTKKLTLPRGGNLVGISRLNSNNLMASAYEIKTWCKMK